MLKSYTLYFVFSFLKTLTITKIINAFLLRISYTLSVITNKHIHWGTLESLSVEPTNTCNLQCPECAIGSKMLNRKIDALSLTNFKKTINECYKKLIYLQLYFQGEPFINSQIYEFIQYAVQKNIFVSTSTNGHFLTPQNCDKIIKSGLQQIIVSIDGTTQSVFEKYRVGGSLNTVLMGIKNLQEAKKNAKKNFPHIVIQFVVFGFNEHQISDIKNIANKLKIKDLRLKSAQINNVEKENNLLPNNKKYSRYKKNKSGIYELKRKKKFKCFRVWSGAVVSSNMQLLPCCFDKSALHSFGSIKTKSIYKQWKNTIATAFRKKVWQNPKQQNICKNCSEGLKKTWFWR